MISETEKPHRPKGTVGPIPERLGRYEVIDRLAVGGMAEVFVGYERGIGGLERLAVVKRILPQLAALPAFVSMFMDEARFVALINHPNVVKIFELEEDEHGTPYIAMEFIAGSSVRELIVAAIDKKERTPIGAVVGIVLQACAGAHAAHELLAPDGQALGLVHRDISPHNLMVTAEGHVKLLDFGIAKATESAALDDQTRTAGLKGKVHYMSPEQLQQHDLDRRSDVFALAIVLWEALASDRLFRRKSELETMHAIVNGEQKDLHAYRDDVPHEIIRILGKALSPDRDGRFETADQLRKALLDACASNGIECGADAVAAWVRPLVGAAQRDKEATLLARARGEPRGPVLPPTAAPDDATVAPSDGADSTRVLDVAVDDTPPNASRRRLIIGSVAAAGLVLGIAVGSADRVVGPTGEPMTVAFPPTADTELMLEDLETLRLWLETSLDRPVTFAVADSYEDLQGRALRGEVDVAALPPYLYVETKSKDEAITAIATKEVQGSSGNDSIIYVRDDADITGVAQLEGKTLCIPDKKSTTGYLFPRLALRRSGLDPDKAVEIEVSGSHMQSLRNVVEGVCDATATYSGGFLGADRAGVPVARLRQLAIIARSPHTAFVVPKHVAAKERDRIQKAFLSFVPEDGGKNGRVERISGFREPDEAGYQAVRDALLER